MESLACNMLWISVIQDAVFWPANILTAYSEGGDDILMISLLPVAAGRLARCTAIQFIAVGVAARI